MSNKKSVKSGVMEWSDGVNTQSDTINDKDQKSNTVVDYPVGYACICGFKASDRQQFTAHLMQAGRRDGKGTHKSLGQINLNTGQIVHPPWEERSDEEKIQTMRKPKSEKNEERVKSVTGSDGKGKKPTGFLPSITQQINVVPRSFTMNYTPIMRAAQDAAIKFFKWRQDMPLENFLDTCLYLFFFEKGIQLGAYIVDERLLKKEVPSGS